jgi:hypothetical protein
MERQPNANRSWRPAASPDRPTPGRTLVASHSQPVRPRSPAFSLCSAIPQNRATSAKFLVQMRNAIWPSSILYFPSSLVSALPRCVSASPRFVSHSTPFRPLSHGPETGLGAHFTPWLNIGIFQIRQPSSTVVNPKREEFRPRGRRRPRADSASRRWRAAGFASGPGGPMREGVRKIPHPVHPVHPVPVFPQAPFSWAFLPVFRSLSPGPAPAPAIVLHCASRGEM